MEALCIPRKKPGGFLNQAKLSIPSRNRIDTDWISPFLRVSCGLLG